MAALSTAAIPVPTTMPLTPLKEVVVDVKKPAEVKDVKSAEPIAKESSVEKDAVDEDTNSETDTDKNVSAAVKAAMAKQYPIYMVHSKKSLPEIAQFLREYSSTGQRVVSLTCVFGKGHDGAYTQKPMTIVVMSPAIYEALQNDGWTEFDKQFKHYVVQPFHLRPHHIREQKSDLKWAIPLPAGLGKTSAQKVEQMIAAKIDQYASLGLLSKADYRVDVPLTDRITGEPGKVAYVVLREGVDIGAAAAVRCALDGSLWNKDDQGTIFACRWNMKKTFVKKPIIKPSGKAGDFTEMKGKRPASKKFTKFDRKSHADK